MNNFTEDQQKMLKNMGALGYDARKISSITGLDIDLVEADFRNPDSDLKKLYQSGADMAQYKIDLKLLEMAMAGDLKAMQTIEINKRKKR